MHTTEIANELALQVHLRRYQELCAMVDELIKEQGWNAVVSIFQQIHENKEGNVHVRKGVLRDALFNILGLECVTGLDYDLLQTFKRINAQDLQTLREKVIPIAIRKLKTQITKKNTYFIDTERLLGTPFETIVPLIGKVRTKEFLALGDSPSFNRAVSTYYGFSYILGKETDGFAGKIKGKRPSYNSSHFSHCSDYLANLLVNMLRLANARPQTQVKGAEALGLIGDSRAIDVLHESLKKRPARDYYASPFNRVLYKVFPAIGNIGLASSMDHIKPFIADHSFDWDALQAISNIRHPESVEILLERIFGEMPFVERNHQWRNTDHNRPCSPEQAVSWLYRPRDERAIAPLVKLLDNKYQHEEALYSLIHLGNLASSAIIENMSKIYIIIRDSYSSRGWMESLARCVPSIKDHEVYLELLEGSIGKSSNSLAYGDLLKCHSGLVEHERIRRSVLNALKNSESPELLVKDIHELGLLKNNEFKKLVREKIPHIARRLERKQRKKDWRYELELDSACSLHILYTSSKIREGLAEAIQNTYRPCIVLRMLKKYGRIQHPLFYEALLSRLSNEEHPYHLIMEIVSTPELMQMYTLRMMLVQVLYELWGPKGKYSIQSSETESIITSLRNHSEVLRMELFQKGFARYISRSLNLQWELEYLIDIPELIDSRPIDNALTEIVATTHPDLLKKLLPNLPEKHQVTSRQRLEDAMIEKEKEVQRRKIARQYYHAPLHYPLKNEECFNIGDELQ